MQNPETYCWFATEGRRPFSDCQPWLPTAKQRAAGGTPHRSQPWHTKTPAHTHTGRMCCSSDHAAREQRRSTLARTRSNAPFSRLLPTHPQAPANPSKSLHALPTPCSMRQPPFPQHKCTSRGEIEHERVDPNASDQPTQEKTTANAAGAPPATLKGEGGSRSFPEAAGRRDEGGRSSPGLHRMHGHTREHVQLRVLGFAQLLERRALTRPLALLTSGVI